MLATITAVAVLLGALIALPAGMTLIFGRLVSLAIFMTVLLGVIHGRGRLRTFCTGGLVAAAYHLLPELIAARRGGTDLLLADLAESLLKRQGPAGVSREVVAAVTALSSTLELLVAVAALGFFSVWIRSRIERRQPRAL